MIHPDQAFALATKSLLVPTASATSTVAPIPTVTPDVPIYEEIARGGQITLWIVFALMLVSTLTFIGLAWRVPVQKRLFHVITTFITLFATISYFAMATGDGSSFTHIVVKSVHKHTPDTTQDVFRQVFWARYVDWSITTPLLLLDLAFLAGLNGADIIVSIVADVVMVLTGLFAAYGYTDTQKWGYFVIALLAYITVLWQFIVGGRRAVKSKSTATAKFFTAIAGFTFVIWTLYPIVWALGDGSRTLSVDSEIIAYAVLDVLAKPVFGFWLLITHARNDPTSVEGFWSHGLASEGALHLDDDEGA